MSILIYICFVIGVAIVAVVLGIVYGIIPASGKTKTFKIAFISFNDVIFNKRVE